MLRCTLSGERGIDGAQPVSISGIVPGGRGTTSKREDGRNLERAKDSMYLLKANLPVPSFLFI